MFEWVAKYWLEVLFAGVTGLVVALWRQVVATRTGLRALLRNDIIRVYNDRIHRHYIPIYEMESVTHMYEAYHQLGGNGTVTKLYKELQQLPSTPPEDTSTHTEETEGGNSCLKMVRDKTSS